MFKVYSDSDTYVSFNSEGFARCFYKNALTEGFALLVQEVGSYSIVEGASLEEPSCMTTEQLEAYLKSL
jgi:hypothetical protein